MIGASFRRKMMQDAAQIPEVVGGEGLEPPMPGDAQGPDMMMQGGMEQAGPQMPQMGMMQPQQPQRRGIDLQQIGAMILAANGNPLGRALMEQQGSQRELQMRLQAQQQMAAMRAQNPQRIALQQQYEFIRTTAGQEAADSFLREQYDPVRTTFGVVGGVPGFVSQRSSQIGGSRPPAAPTQGLSDEEFNALPPNGGGGGQTGSGGFQPRGQW